MLAKINPGFRMPVLAAVAIGIAGLGTYMVVGGESEQKQQVSKKTTKKQAISTTNGTKKKVNKRTTSSKTTKRKVVRVNRPGMKYRIVRVVEEPTIKPAKKLRKATGSSTKEKDAQGLAQN